MQRTLSDTAWLQVMNARDGTVDAPCRRAGASPAPGRRTAPPCSSPPTGRLRKMTWSGASSRAGSRCRSARAAVPPGRPTAAGWPSARAGAGGRPQVWVMNPDGSDLIQLTTDGGEDPAWSPDGRLIAYAFNGRVFVMTAGGADRRQISSGDELFDRNPILRWSPDASRLAYAVFQQPQAPRPSAIYVATLAGGPTLHLSGDYQPPLAWSPDGAWLALVRGEEVWGLRHRRRTVAAHRARHRLRLGRRTVRRCRPARAHLCPHAHAHAHGAGRGGVARHPGDQPQGHHHPVRRHAPGRGEAHRRRRLGRRQPGHRLPAPRPRPGRGPVEPGDPLRRHRRRTRPPERRALQEHRRRGALDRHAAHRHGRLRHRRRPAGPARRSTPAPSRASSSPPTAAPPGAPPTPG